MSESENLEPVVSSDSSDEPHVSKRDEESTQSSEAEPKQLNSPNSPQNTSERLSEPDVVSSSRESSSSSGGQVIRNNQDMRDSRNDDDDEDDDSNDGVVAGSNGDRDFNAAICSPYAAYPPPTNSKSNPFSSATSQNILRGPILRPSTFKFGSGTPVVTTSQPAPQSTTTSQQTQQNTSAFILRPPKLIPTSGSVGCKVTAQVASSSGSLQFVPLEKDLKDEVGGGIVSPVDGDKESSAGSSDEFVFGKNFNERAVAGDVALKKRKIDSEGEDEVGSSGVKKPSVVISGSSGEDGGGEVIREVITGEEGEVNVLQLNCRLFIFDGVKSTWVERGRGLLRLNDDKVVDDTDTVGSRLIVRSKGSLRVMLNSKVWDGMRVEKVGDKNVRLMAVDLDGVDDKEEEDKGAASLRIFLVMTNSISDAHTLVNALNARVRKLN